MIGLKCFCPHYNSLKRSHSFSKSNGFLNCIVKGGQISYRWNSITFVEREKKVKLIAAIKCLILAVLPLLLGKICYRLFIKEFYGVSRN